jgi:hypothetical protein
MRKLMAIAALSFAAFAFPTTNVRADFVPVDGWIPGTTQYEILYVTTPVFTATSTAIASYNSDVQSQLNPALLAIDPTPSDWHAIASTASVNASSNAPSSPGIPVYTITGQLITNAGLYSGANLLTAPNVLPSGQTSVSAVWTGSTYSGSALFNGGSPYGSYALGGGQSVFEGYQYVFEGYEYVFVGYESVYNPATGQYEYVPQYQYEPQYAYEPYYISESYATAGQDSAASPSWIDDSYPYYGQDNAFALYGLSSPIDAPRPPAPSPEPTTITLLASGFLGFGGFGLYRRRRRASST